MRRVAIGVLSMMLVLFVGPAASASRPTIQRFPVDLEFVDSSCGFDVDFHITGFVVDIQRTDASGNLHDFQAYPQYKLELTNVDTGTSITVGIAGPQHITERADGTTRFIGTGVWQWFSHPTTGQPGLTLTEGRFVFDDAAGTFTIVGHVVDLCSKLAA